MAETLSAKGKRRQYSREKININLAMVGMANMANWGICPICHETTSLLIVLDQVLVQCPYSLVPIFDECLCMRIYAGSCNRCIFSRGAYFVLVTIFEILRYTSTIMLFPWEIISESELTCTMLTCSLMQRSYSTTMLTAPLHAVNQSIRNRINMTLIIKAYVKGSAKAK